MMNLPPKSSGQNQSAIDRAAWLLNQQIWCWGKDIECAEGNLLLQHGFQRIEKPADSDAASIYRLDLSPNSRLVLRGFGVYYGDDRWGGVYVHRFDFAPELTPHSDLEKPLWSQEDLPELVLPRSDEEVLRCQNLLLALIDWVRQYEVWISECRGNGYRQDSLSKWNPKGETVVPGDQIVSAWSLLGTDLEENPRAFMCNPDVGDLSTGK